MQHKVSHILVISLTDIEDRVNKDIERQEATGLWFLKDIKVLNNKSVLTVYEKKM